MSFSLGQNIKFPTPINLTTSSVIRSDLIKASDFIRSFFSGTGGKVASTAIKVGGSIGLGGAAIGAGLNQLTSNVPDPTTGKGLGSWLIIGIVAFIIIMVIMKR